MNHKPLGRGLGALIQNTAPKEAAAVAVRENSALIDLRIAQITPGQFQPRGHFDEARLEELKRAIQSQGIIEPLIVRRIENTGENGSARYELIAGERRLRAARAAGLEAVPVLVRDLDDRAALEMSLVENLAREDLNALEEGRAFARLVREFALSHDDIAARIGKSRPYVSNAIRLTELPAPVLEMIARGELSAGQARPLLALSGAQAQIAAAKKIVESGISARGAEEIAAAHRKQASAGKTLKHAASDPNLTALTESLQRALKRKVRVIRRRGKSPGRIEIDFYDDSDLTALAAQMIAASHAELAQ